MDGIRGSGCLVQDVSRVGIVQWVGGWVDFLLGAGGWVGGGSVVSCCTSRRGASTKHNNNK